MNKKCMLKVGTMKLVVALALVLMMPLFFILLTSANSELIYELDEKIKIDIGEIGEYVMAIQTPKQTFLYKSNKSYFLFKPDYLGDYIIDIKSDAKTEQIFFKVIEPEKQGQNKTVRVPIEDISQEAPVPQETIIETQGVNEFLIKQITVGEPVKWEEEIKPGRNIQIKIPEVSSDILVSSGDEGIDFKVKTSFTDSLSNIVSSENKKTVTISEAIPNTKIEYQTPSPIKKEKIISGEKKEVEISSDLHYENVLAYTNLPKELDPKRKDSITVYWKEENKFIIPEVFDKDNNGLLDYIEWTVPHLSTQTFEIIVIVKADHLDENREFVEDVYDKVKEKDGIWQSIPSNDYIRVVFEKLLFKQNDITIYAKSDDPGAKVEVYEKDGIEKIADFGEISQEGYYRILLTELIFPQDTFDLKILGGNILFDLIIDPLVNSTIIFESFESDSPYYYDAAGNWTRDVTAWDRDGGQSQCGSFSAHVDASATATDYITLDANITNLSGATSATISFEWWCDAQSDNGEYFSYDEYYSGSWNDDVYSYHMQSCTNNWISYERTIPAGALQSDFRIRFAAETNAANEDIYIDCVNITREDLVNSPPSTTTPGINSTSGTNLTDQDLNCFGTLTDPEGDTLDASVRWYKNDSLISEIDYNNSYSNGTSFSAALLSGNTSVGDVWACSLRAFDGEFYSSWLNSSNLTILDAGTPINITLVTPIAQSYPTVSVPINVTINKATDWCGYSLDGAANVSLTKINNTFFSSMELLSGGEHDMDIYCNDTFGVYDSANVSFLVDATQYKTIGEWGVVEDIPPAVWNTVYFQNSFEDIPVIVHQIDYGYDYDDNPCTTRVRAITEDSFQIRTDSWSETASCPATGIDGYWLAMEKGIHNVSNAGTPVREVEVVNFTMDVGACGSGANPTDWTYSANHRYFQNSWSYQPLVLAAVQTANDVDPISQYARGCTDTNSDTWNTTCVEIGLNGMENDGAIQPCNLHTKNEEGGYIAWEMNSDWSNSETRDNNGSSGDGAVSYFWEAYWESDSVRGSDNDAYPMSTYYITLSQNYSAGIALGSGIRVDGNNGVFPTVHYDAPDNQVFLLSDEDMFGDSEQGHVPEPYELLFFNSSTGFLFSDEILDIITVVSPINNTVYGSSTINFNVSTSVNSDSCWFSLDGTANTTMDKADSKNFDYDQAGLSDTMHNITFYCNNTYGGEYSSELYNFSVDSTPLIVGAVLPLPQSYNTSSLTFAANTTKAVSWCSYSLNGATNVSMNEINSTYFSIAKNYLREGNHDIDYYCGGAGESNSTSVSFSVATNITENVSRGAVTLSDGSSEVNVSFSTQDLSKAFLIFSVRSGASGPSQLQILGELMEDKINFRRYSTTGDVYIEWTVIESPDLYVQRGSADYSSGSSSDTATIGATNLSESFTIVSNRLDSGTSSENTQGFWAAKFNSATEIGISRGATGSAGEFHWQSIEWDGSSVQSGYKTGTGTSFSETLTTAVNTSRSFITLSRQIAGGTVIQENFIRGFFPNSTTIEFYKEYGTATYGVAWFVVENNRFTSQSGLRSLTGATAVNVNISQIELNKSFSLETRSSTGGGTTYANAFLTNKLFNTTAIQFQKGTASQTQEINWFVVELGEAAVDFMNIISPKAQTYATTTIDFNMSLSENGSWCGYSLDGAANVTMTSLNATYFYDTQAGLGSTTHNVTFYCNNTLGTMYESNNVVFEVDMSAPNVTSLSPANSTTNTTNTLYFSYNTTDNSGVDSCSLIANEQVVWVDTSITMDTTQFFEVFLDNGIYTWYVNCSDDGGLTASSEKRIINVSGPATYSWGNRFYETSTSNFTSAADIKLNTSRDSTENEVSMTLPASGVTTVTTAKSPYLGNGGAIIPASTIIDFSGYTTVSTNNVGYLTWKVYVENSSGDFLICQSGDDSTEGTRMSAAASTWAGTCNSPAYDLVLKKSDRIKMVLNVYNSDTSSLNFSHVWDDLKLSYVNFMTFTVLGALEVDLTYPTTNISINRESTTNITCETSCTVGNCLNTNIYAQRYNGTDWINIDSSGSIILDTGETNPHAMGSVSSAVSTNFTLYGDAVSLNDIRCIGTSTYSSATGTTVKEIEVLDSNLAPNIYLTNPDTAYFSNTSQITLFYNASDENNNIVNTTLILDGQVNMSNSSVVINNQINNFTITLADGNYNWTVNATDSALETGTDATVRTFTIDTGIPQITLHDPKINESLGSVLVNFNFTVIDNLDSDLTCNLTVDGLVIEPGFSATNSTYKNLTKTIGLGDHLWNVSCQDDANNLNFSETRNFSVSDTPPFVELLTTDPTWFTSGTVDLEYNVTDNGQIKNCSLYLNGIFNQSNATSITQGEANDFSLVGVLDGEYNWSVSCQDDADLISSTTNRTFYVDSTFPIINLNLPANLTTSTSADVNFNFTTIDNLDTDLTCDLIINSSIVVPGFSATNDTLTNNLVTDLIDGAHSWLVNCTDTAGNQNSSETRIVTVEAPPVVVLDTLDNSWFFSDVELDYTPTDNTNFSNCSLIINGAFNRSNSTPISNGAQNTFTVDDVSDGIYNWSVNCTDTYSLTSSAGETRTAYRDSQAPVVNLSTPADGDNVFSGDIEFNFTVTDNLANNITCNITVDGSVVDPNFNTTNATLTNRTNSVAPAQHFWNVTCWDMLGTTATSPTWNFTNFEAPSVTLDSPENNTWLNYSSVVLKYDILDSDNNLANCSLYLDGAFNQSNSTIVNNGAINNFTVSVPEGSHNWTVECIDYTSLTGTDDYWNLYIDLTVPNITTNEPLPNETLTWNNATFNFTATDNLDSTLNCSLIIDEFSSPPEIENIVAPNATDKLVYAMRPDGDYDWQIRCLDEAGNSYISPIQNFTMDAPPIVSLNSPADDNRTTSANFVFNYTPQSADGITQCEIYIDEILNDTETTIFPNQPNTFNVNGVPEGKHNWSISCLDVDSNTGSSDTWIFYRDITPPVIVLNSPDNDTTIDANDDVTFNWLPTDALGTLLTCDLVIDGSVNDSGLATSGFPREESIGGFSIGSHLWNVTCSDEVGNTNTSETRSFNYSYPDLMVNASTISFSTDTPTENETITINATVYNIGSADVSSVDVKFYLGDPDAAGTQILPTKTISIGGLSSNVTSVTWNATLGSSQIYVVVDYPDTLTENNESNNKVSKNITVGSWHLFYGDINTGTQFTLTDSSEYEVIEWNITDFSNMNIYVADYDATINWISLQAIGKNVSGLNSSSDISEIDTILGSSAFEDSVTVLYMDGASINETQNFTIFKQFVPSVPVATSITSANFKTGILWDMSDDSNSEYDSAEKEDIVFVTKVNENTAGSYGVTDYEMRVPALLRDYDQADRSTAAFYIEIN